MPALACQARAASEIGSAVASMLDAHVRGARDLPQAVGQAVAQVHAARGGPVMAPAVRRPGAAVRAGDNGSRTPRTARGAGRPSRRAALRCSIASPAAASPTQPVTYTSSPGRAPRAGERPARFHRADGGDVDRPAGPGVRVMLPPRMAVRWAAACTQEAVDETVEHGGRQVGRQRQREQSRPRFRAHRGQVAEIHGQRPVADGVGRHERLIEVDAVHERIGREHLAAPPRRLHDGGVVARADVHPRRDVEAASDALDERLLAEVSYGGIGHEDLGENEGRTGMTPVRQNLMPRFAVWGGRMNLLKQVEPL